MKLFTLLKLKQTVVVVAVFTSVLVASAQTTFSITPSSGVITSTVPCDSLENNHFYVVVPKVSAGVELRWKVTTNTLPPANSIATGDGGCWDILLCDWLICSTPPAIDAEQNGGNIKPVIASDTSIEMKLGINPLKVKGNGQLVIKVYESSYPNNFKTLTWNYTGCPTGSVCATSVLEEEINNSYIIYPNPAQNYITIERVKNNNVDLGIVEIYNIVGKKLMQLNEVNSTKLKIDISSLPAGAYFVKRYNATEGTSLKQFFKIK